MAEKIICLAAAGLSIERIAQACSLGVTTVYQWMQLNPEFADAVKNARNNAEGMIEAAMIHRAKGYSHPATKVHWDKDGVLHTKQVVEHYPPSETAASFLLRNWNRKKWRESSSRELSGPDGGPIEGVLPKIVVMIPQNGYEAKEEPAKIADNEEIDGNDSDDETEE